MARPSTIEYDKLSDFARWLVDHITRRGTSVQRVAEVAEMHVSQLHKIIKSYKPEYAKYRRPGYEKTVTIGRWFDDVNGALESAGFTKIKDEEDQSQGVRDYQPGYNGMVAIPGAESVSVSGFAFDRLSPKSRELVVRYAKFLEQEEKSEAVTAPLDERETEKTTD